MTDRITLKPDEAAAMLGVGTTTLQEWTRDGFLPSIHRGGVRLYSVRALERWADEASAYEETRRGKAAGVGSGVGLQADWGQPVGRVRQGRRRSESPLRLHGTGGPADAG